ncbi:lytic murein transglycosylase [Roseospirillum parvum]|uniref:Membrane-bound lytic murein transglycosylase B n=1 Tax=Roseospirillum parvum TaxID=83401 RepID=A0A1G7Y7S5_9PROT|nr:lytic murein transglycosylase [Roseospirillum parvum]SDG92407.1 membrane-bound lytic murein transglycosylase B [Roseospirillum parvum]
MRHVSLPAIVVGVCALLIGCAAPGQGAENEPGETAAVGAEPTPPAQATAPPAAEPVTPAPPPEAAPPFDVWLAGLRAEARGRGVSEATLDAALTGIAPLPKVLEYDQRQPEFTRTFWDYIGRAVDPSRIARGQDLLAQHAGLLARAEARFGVPAHVLVAFWGLETDFGRHFGGFPVVEALATLAHDRRRSAFFRQELLLALDILERGDIPAPRMVGSWAGAMGHFQFLPSTFTRHAVDADGDGRRDIWGSLPDAVLSAGNFLGNLGWRAGELWGREVSLPEGFDYALADGQVEKPLAAWQALGVRRADGRPLPVAEMEAALLVPAGHQGPAFLVYPNFRVILDWNRSELYALAVGHLSDRLAGRPGLSVERPADLQPLRPSDIARLQAALADLGFDPGPADGMLGPRTRGALRAWQQAHRLPADGYPTRAMIGRIVAEAEA